ncbi:hypothetical protein [Paenibacillus wenxiniae]|uniref:Uncharacterized protein n=1 Tax=Paenibacillus wenxiniae TaxID=1636843 RepID=A0ABW4RDE6_9BACL
MTRRLNFMKSNLLLLFLFSFSLFYSNNIVSASDADVLTPVAYEKYLQTLINSGDIGAKETLTKFNNLENDQQEAFIKFLASPHYLNALQAGLNGENDLTYNMDGTDVKVEIKGEDIVNNTSPQFSLAATQTSASRSITLEAFGIDTTTITLTVNWEHNSSVAVRPLSVTQGHTNRNPILILSEQSSTHPGYVSGGYYYGGGKWKMYATGAAGAISDTVGIDIKGTTFQNKYFSVYSSHPGIPNVTWAKF